jgi:hypothetical protein
MKQPDALDAARFADGHGADETFCRPFVKLRACATGIKFMPVLWRSHPYRKITFAVTGNFCGAGLCGHNFQKIFAFTIHATETLRDPRQAQMYHIHFSTAGALFTPAPKVSTSSVQSRSRTAQTGARSIRRPLTITRLQTVRNSQDKPYPFASEGFGVRETVAEKSPFGRTNGRADVRSHGQSVSSPQARSIRDRAMSASNP